MLQSRWFCPREWGLFAEAFFGIARRDPSLWTDEVWVWCCPWVSLVSRYTHFGPQKVAWDPKVKLHPIPPSSTWLELDGKIQRFWMSENPIHKTHALCCMGRTLSLHPVPYPIYKESKYYAKWTSSFWIPSLSVCATGKPFDEYFFKSLDCSFVIGSITEKTEQRLGIRFRS